MIHRSNTTTYWVPNRSQLISNEAQWDAVLPLIDIPQHSSSRRVQQRRQFPSSITSQLTNQTITALNQLSNSCNINPKPSLSLLSSPDTIPPASQRHQLQPPTIHRCHQHIYDSCAYFRRHSSGDRSSAIDDSSILNDLSFGYSSPVPVKTLVADKVSLPAVAGTAKLLEVLPPHLAALYSKPKQLLVPPVTSLHTKRPVMLATPVQYCILIRRMMDKGMIAFTIRPKAVNGLFGVDKDNGAAIRLIVDARPVNSMFVPSPHVNLPTPDLIAGFHIPDGVDLYAAKIDLDNFYHRIRLPPQWWPYFALPPINSSDLQLSRFPPNTMVYPCCTTMPMGFSHAVFLAQAAHEHLIDTRVPLLRRTDRIARTMPNEGLLSTHWVPNGPTSPSIIPSSMLDPPSTDLNIDRMRHSVYIDDLNIYGSDPIIIQAAMDQYCAVLADANLPPKPSKIVRPSSSGVECLGIMVHGQSGRVGMSIPKLQTLRASTLKLLDHGQCTGQQLAHIVGRWNWAMLIRRPAMSVFSAVYRFIECAHHRMFNLWPSVRRELWIVSHLAPLLYTNVRSHLSTSVIATDASEWGCGMVYTDAGVDSATSLVDHVGVPGTTPHPVTSQFVNEAKWKTALSHPWSNQQEHINVLEVRAVLQACRWMVRRPTMFSPDGHRVVVLADSSATVGALTKGRSSSPALLYPIRSMTTLLLASGVSLILRWIPSLLNPADGASRGRRRVTHELCTLFE